MVGGASGVTDRTSKRDRRDAQRKKVWPVHGRSLQAILNAIAKRGRKALKQR